MTQVRRSYCPPMTAGESPFVLRKLWLRPGLRPWAVVMMIVFSVAAWMANTGAQSLPRSVQFATNLPLGLVLSIAIGSFAWTLFPVVMRAAARWHWSWAAAWALYVATMAFCAVAGTAAVYTVPFLVGVIP